jgi:peptide/nickel transport system permease protein
MSDIETGGDNQFVPDPNYPSDDAYEPDDADDEVVQGGTRKQIRREQRRVLFTTPGFIIGMAILLFWVVSATFPELLTNSDPKELGVARQTPNGDAWFGTDGVGRDVYSRVIHGSRPILIVAPIATLIALMAGTLIGLSMGYFRGWVDEILSRLVESVLSIPAILMAILVIVTFGKTDPVVIGTIALLFTPPVARTVRAAAISESQLDYVTSAKMRGERSFFIIGREILPNVTGLLVVELTVRLGYAVFTVATLAFLGLAGGDITDPNWGVDVAENWGRIVGDVWWPTIFPALAIATLVIGVNLVADSIDRATKS